MPNVTETKRPVGVAVVAFLGFNLGGGPISRARSLALGLADAGARARLLAFGDEPPSPGAPSETVQTWRGVPVHCFLPERSLRITTERPLARLWQKWQRDRTYIHQRRLLLAGLERMAALSEIQTVVLHNQQWAASREMLTSCRRSGIKMVQQYVEQHISGDYSGGYLHPHLIRESLHKRFFPRLADGNLVICTYLEQWCRERSVRPCLLIPSLTSTEITPTTEAVEIRAGEPLTFAYIGPGSRRDCIRQMIDAASRLRELELPFRMVLTGLTPQALTLARSQAIGLGVDGSIELNGWQEESVIRRLWRDAPIFMILRTNDRSSRACFPGRVGDYVLHRRALIFTDIPDYNVYFQHKRTAMLVRPEDPVSLADAMEELIRNPSLVEALSRQSSKLATTVFDFRSQGMRLYRWIQDEVHRPSKG